MIFPLSSLIHTFYNIDLLFSPKENTKFVSFQYGVSFVKRSSLLNGFHQIIPAFLKKKTYGSRGFSGSKAVSSSKLGSLGAGGGLCCSHLNIGMYIHIQVAQTMENFYCLSPLFREISVVLQSMLKLEIDCE